MKEHRVQLNDDGYDRDTEPLYYTEDLTGEYTEDLGYAIPDPVYETSEITEDELLELKRRNDKYSSGRRPLRNALEEAEDGEEYGYESAFGMDETARRGSGYGAERGQYQSSCRAQRGAGRGQGKSLSASSSHSSPVWTFLYTFALILGLGFLFLGLYGYVMSADKRAAGMGTLEAITEELIPVAVTAEPEKTVPEETASGVDLTDSAPTASDNIVKTSSGLYALTSTARADSVTFAFAGDILFDDRYAVAATVAERGGSIESSFDEKALSIMRSADVFMLNNEFPYSTRGTATADKTYTFRADPGTANWLKTIGADIVSLANNHAYDYGEDALLDTLDTLDGIGMIHVGAGRNLDEASRPAYFYINGMTVAILNATQIEQSDYPDTKGATADSAGVFRCWDDTNLLAAIREAKEQADIAIVYIHWGTEKMTTPDYYQTSRQQAMADAGADIIIGDHPHVLQPFAYAGNTMIVYSLGNYLFTSYDTNTGIFEVTMQPSTKTITSMQFIPMLQTNCSVRTLDGDAKTEVLDEIRSGSVGVNIDADGYVAKSN